jgi:hypothetical protein
MESDLAQYVNAGWSPAMQFPVVKIFLFFFKRVIFLVTFTREI